MQDELLRLLQGDTLEKTFTLGDVKVVIRTLTQVEKDNVMKNVATFNVFSDVELIKRPILAKAIVSVNGAKLLAFKEILDEVEATKKPASEVIEKYLGKFNSSIISRLYEMYLEVEKEEQASLDQLKKVSAEPSAAPAGNSSK